MHISSAGVTVGEWEGSSAHRIVGTITFPNPNTILIEGFGYDGGGVGELGMEIKVDISKHGDF